MNEAVMKERLSELCDCLTASPVSAKTGSEGMYVSNRSQTVEESLDHLRLQLKYVLFDLEATRRENRYLRQMLDNRPGRDSTGDGGGDKA